MQVVLDVACKWSNLNEIRVAHTQIQRKAVVYLEIVANIKADFVCELVVIVREVGTERSVGNFGGKRVWSKLVMSVLNAELYRIFRTSKPSEILLQVPVVDARLLLYGKA